MNFESYEVGIECPEVRGFFGTEMRVTENGFLLFISFDDLSAEECQFFCKSDIEIVCKSYDLAVICLFVFQDYIVEAPFDLFETYSLWSTWVDNKGEICLDVLICDSTTGKICGKRSEILPQVFCKEWIDWLNNLYFPKVSQYTKEKIQAEFSKIYDNHTIDEIYEMSEGQTFLL